MAESPETATAPSAAPPPPPSLWTKLAYGFGAGVTGVKDNGFAYFLLLFYSQVVGLDARLVGLALTIALMMDAIIDPAVGYWSDNFRSRWGRRHPFMYFAAIPLSSIYFLLWSPPVGWSDMATFWYLLGLAVAIRMTVSIYEIPSTALAPELSQDYDQRSSLLSFRSFFGWTVGNTMSVLMFAVLFPMFVTADINVDDQRSQAEFDKKFKKEKFGNTLPFVVITDTKGKALASFSGYKDAESLTAMIEDAKKKAAAAPK